MKFTVKQNAHSYSGHGCWYISDENNNNYLGRDLEIHGSTWCYASCSWVGYYKSKEEAEQFLKLFKEKYNAAENKMVISVKVNGMPVPLHEISEQTLLAVREASKKLKLDEV